jgi:hypothetical protein
MGLSLRMIEQQVWPSASSRTPRASDPAQQSVHVSKQAEIHDRTVTPRAIGYRVHEIRAAGGRTNSLTGNDESSHNNLD